MRTTAALQRSAGLHPRVSRMPRNLKPTLWRTCRVLANIGRLGVLEHLRRHGAASVASVGHGCGLSRVCATLALRALQARGLLRATRVSRWVIYYPEPDPLVQHAPELLAAVMAAFQRKMAPEALCKQATAFTHERRIRIVQALAVQSSAAVELALRCRISLPALDRHLDKLARRGFVRQDSGTAIWHLVRPDDPFGRALLRLALGDGQG